MRVLRTMFVSLLILFGLVCARQSNAQTYYPKGFEREWHNSAGQVIGYSYKPCDGPLQSYGITTGAPTVNQHWACDPIVQNPDSFCQYLVYLQRDDGSGFRVVMSVPCFGGL
jgi:hypothetical protein